MSNEAQDFSGRSVAEAAIKACETYGITRSALKYKVLKEEGEGLGRRVQISAWPEPGAVVTEAPQQAAQDGQGDAGASRPAAQGRGERSERGERSSRGGRGGRGGRDNRGERGERDNRGGRASEQHSRERNDEREDVEALLNLTAIAEKTLAKRPRIEQGSELAEGAREVLGKMLTLAQLDVRVDVVEDGDKEIHLEIVGEDESWLIGKRGEALQACQFLANRIWQRDPEDEHLLVLDAAGYRQRRREALEELAVRLATKAIDNERIVKLRPMSAHDRRVIHMALREVSGVETQSEGDGLFRQLLIIPDYFEPRRAQ